jgi:DNA polymerase III gamma/tau subunit
LLKGIRYQEVAIRMLKHEIRQDKVPRAMLFYGPDGSGKFLTAVEVVRVLNCRKKGEEECRCPSCVEVKKLIANDMFVICRSNLKNSFDLWRKFGLRESNLEPFITDIRRFMLTISHDERYGKEFQTIAGFLRSKEEIRTEFSSVTETVCGIIDTMKYRVITIDQIREAQRFLSLKSGYARYRVLIIDGAESMNEEAQNSFLKISEDTPEGSLIILTAVSQDGLKPTIVSRCRLYRFKRLKSAEERKLIGDRWSIFGDEAVRLTGREIDGVNDYMTGIFRKLESEAGNIELIGEIADEINRKGAEVGFFTHILDSLSSRVRSLQQAEVKEICDFERFLKRTENAKRSIMYANTNREIVLLDFLLNNIQDVVEYCSTGA